MLTFTTGLVDAVSYLGIGHVFTANMTGNIVFLGFGIAGSGGLPVIAPLVSLVDSWRVLAAAACWPRGWRSATLSTSLGRCDRGAASLGRGDPRGGRHGPRKRSLGRCRDRLAGVRDGRSQRDDSPSGSARSDDDRAHDDVDRPGRRLATVRRVRKGLVRRTTAVLAMLLGALAGALLLKTSLFLPLPAARPGAQGRPSTAPAELIDRRQILIGEVPAGGHKRSRTASIGLCGHSPHSDLSSSGCRRNCLPEHTPPD